jgi:hypothetical protein
MELRMEPIEPKLEGIMTRSGNGHALQFLPASKEFSTRSCARCAGLLVNDWCYDLDSTGEYTVEVLRCVQCGHRIDPVILRNQMRPRGESQRVRRVRHKYSVRTLMSGEVT